MTLATYLLPFYNEAVFNQCAVLHSACCMSYIIPFWSEWSSPNSGLQFSFVVPKHPLGVVFEKSRTATVCAIYYLGQELILKEVPLTICECQRLWFGYERLDGARVVLQLSTCWIMEINDRVRTVLLKSFFKADLSFILMTSSYLTKCPLRQQKLIS